MERPQHRNGLRARPRHEEIVELPDSPGLVGDGSKPGGAAGTFRIAVEPRCIANGRTEELASPICVAVPRGVIPPSGRFGLVHELFTAPGPTTSLKGPLQPTPAVNVAANAAFAAVRIRAQKRADIRRKPARPLSVLAILIPPACVFRHRGNDRNLAAVMTDASSRSMPRRYFVNFSDTEPVGTGVTWL